MDADSKPSETDIVLVHDKILMALLTAKRIKPRHIFSTDWPYTDPSLKREACLAYELTEEVKQLIKAFEKCEVTVNLEDYLNSADELEYSTTRIVYRPRQSNEPA